MKANIDTIIKICNSYGILQKSRRQDLVFQRYAVFNYLRKKTNLSVTAIGSLIGDKNHSTVLNGLKVYDNMIATKDINFKLAIEEIEERLRNTERLEFIERPKIVVRYKQMRAYKSSNTQTV